MIATAVGEAQRFSMLAAQYRLAPEVTRKRLMLETMQEVLAGSPKVVVEGGGEKVLYLPLDRINHGLGGSANQPSSSQPSAAPVIEAVRGRETGRGGRDGGRN